jgi:hypothetical protein
MDKITNTINSFYVNVITKHMYYDQNSTEKPIVDLRNQCYKGMGQLEALKEYFRKYITLHWEIRRRKALNQTPIDAKKEEDSFLQELKAKLRERSSNNSAS